MLKYHYIKLSNCCKMLFLNHILFDQKQAFESSTLTFSIFYNTQSDIYSILKIIFLPYFPQWVPEISHHCPRTPFLLVGTQVDLREDSNTIEKLAKNKQRPLYPESGEKLARELKAVKYVECSALTQVTLSSHC